MEQGKSVMEGIKYEEGKSNLTEAQINAIAQEALGESSDKDEDDWKNPADENKTGQEQRAEAKEADDQKKAADDKAAEEAKPKEEELKEGEVKDDKVADAKQLTPEEKVAADAAAKDKPFQLENRTQAIEALALKDSLTLEEAEAQIVKDEAIVNKYKNNPIEMAKAMRELQSYASKTKAELDATRKAATNPPAPIRNNIKEYVQNQLEPIKDKVIAAFRAEYPEITDGQEDTYVYGLIKKDAVERTLKVLDENESKIVSAAQEKRANLILNLSEQDKVFLPDIKAIIDRTSDRQLMDKTWDLKDVVYWAKGKQFERIVKEKEDAAFKRGQEQAKILGEKTPSSKTPAPSGVAKKSSLNDEQKQRAQDMFDIPGMSDQEKFDAYIDTYPEEFKK